MRQLEKLGIKTVVNLRFILSDRKKIKGTGLDYEHINMTTFHVNNADVVRFLEIVTDRNRTPVFVHCQRGIERAGTMCAVYRIVVQGWSKDEAIEEMTKGSFAYRNVSRSLVNYIRELNVDRNSLLD
jgi:protein tyrosine/serine phosphatase